MSALFGTYARSELAFVRGEGMRLFTEDGTAYLDFASGIAVNALGYGDQHVTDTLKAQADKVWHVSNLFTIPEQEKLAQRLVDATFADAVFFTNSGAEALECAIKTARRYFWDKGEKQRIDIIGFTGSFHGRTIATLGAAGNAAYTEGFGPMPGYKHVHPGDLAAVEAVIDGNTAAILIEPVQGEGGVTAFSDAYLKGLRELCDKYGLLLIYDEVQCGYGRTGKFFAYEWSGVAPDILAVAKAIGGGFPLGACLATAEVARVMVPGTHGSTYGGNPLACAVGNAVLDRILAPGFIEHVEQMGKLLAYELQQLMQKYPGYITDVRGKGLLAGIKITPPVRAFVERLRDHKLLTVAAGDNVLRLLPPLIATEADIREATGILAAAFAELDAEASSAAQ
ncbi:MAG TPA: aspartate aminotransferase family protein [Pelagibacterium sp.]|uniref:aspartate aminotransferase family protein n=1 Tax=Pelagibacterium sp. TaxID=1967288 RepID=UPI002BA91423|nr:aspartate aminotransferase family protein [Pelagibacterium sp.]HWJ88974.1 aspartate aminotransferase family protein [Pelagibacterium sp.]